MVFKLSTTPVGVVAGLFYVFGGAAFDTKRIVVRFVVAACLGLAVLLPLMMANIAFTGCPAYPSPLFCLDLPWALSSERVAAIEESMRGWNAWQGLSPPPPYATRWNWVDWWFQRVQWHAPVRQFAVITLTGMAVSAVLLLRRPRAPFWTVFAMGLLGIVLIFVLMPQVRFMAGYMVLMSGLALALIGPSVAEWAPVRFLLRGPGMVPAPWLGAVVTAGIAVVIGVGDSVQHKRLQRDPFYVALRKKDLSITDGLERQAILPPRIVNRTQAWTGGSPRKGTRYQMPLKYKRVQGNGFSYNRALKSNWCWAIPQPCTPELLPPKVTLRRPEKGLRGGLTLMQKAKP
jgi:hypothetical protein